MYCSRYFYLKYHDFSINEIALFTTAKWHLQNIEHIGIFICMVGAMPFQKWYYVWLLEIDAFK